MTMLEFHQSLLAKVLVFNFDHNIQHNIQHDETSNHNIQHDETTFYNQIGCPNE